MEGNPKVVHLTSVHAPTDPRITFRECRTLAQARYTVVLVAPGAAQHMAEGVRVRSVPVPRNRAERLTRTIWQVFRASLDEKADVYHFHDPELMGVGLALRATGARVVFDVHEDVPLDIMSKQWIPRALRGGVSRAAALALRALHRFYSAVVVATPSIARHFTAGKTVVVQNCPALEHYEPQPAPYRTRPPAIVYAGNITELRGAFELVRAVEAAGSGIRLTLAGRFESAELEERLRALPGWSSVDYVGWTSPDEIPGLLGKSRAGMLVLQDTPAFAESMPTKLYEYMAAGLPVIISNTLQCSEMVRTSACGIAVDPCDVDAIARAITFIIDHPAEAQAMGERGRTLVNERYQWKIEANKLTQLYATIA